MTKLIPATTNTRTASRAQGARSLRAAQGPVQRYNPYQRPPSAHYAEPAPLPPDPSAANGFAHTLQLLFMQQAFLLREFDLRLKHLEAATRPAPDPNAFYRSTWWMLWGILMLLVGSALTVILFLIFSSLVR